MEIDIPEESTSTEAFYPTVSFVVCTPYATMVVVVRINSAIGRDECTSCWIYYNPDMMRPENEVSGDGRLYRDDLARDKSARNVIFEARKGITIDLPDEMAAVHSNSGLATPFVRYVHPPVRFLQYFVSLIMMDDTSGNRSRCCSWSVN